MDFQMKMAQPCTQLCLSPNQHNPHIQKPQLNNKLTLLCKEIWNYNLEKVTSQVSEND
jgi:hypothetical protein